MQAVDTLWFVLGDSARLVLIVLTLGTAGAPLLTGALESQLYGVAPTDPLTLAADAVLTSGIALQPATSLSAAPRTRTLRQHCAGSKATPRSELPSIHCPPVSAGLDNRSPFRMRYNTTKSSTGTTTFPSSFVCVHCTSDQAFLVRGARNGER